MRVVVHHPERTEPDGTVVPEGKAAYKLGRITDEQCVNHVTGETVPIEALAAALVRAAVAEHPGQQVGIEVLVDNGDGTSSWMPEADVPADALSPGGSTIQGPELTAEQGQEVSS